MQCYIIFSIAVNALHVSGGVSAHQQELKTVHTASGVRQACLLLSLAWVSPNSPRWREKQASLTYTNAVCTVFELPMMGRKTA
jgi:hypothetical protein